VGYDITIKYTPEYLRELSYEELNGFLTQMHQKLFELNQKSFRIGRTKDIPEPHLFKKVKKDIARILTISKERFYV